MPKDKTWLIRDKKVITWEGGLKDNNKNKPFRSPFGKLLDEWHRLINKDASWDENIVFLDKEILPFVQKTK